MLLFILYIYSYTFEFFCQVLQGIWVLKYSNNNDNNNNNNNNIIIITIIIIIIIINFVS